MGVHRREKRTSGLRMDSVQASSSGVGARREDPPGPPQGGGYLTTCSAQNFGLSGLPKNFAPDPRIADLRAMGLAQVWLDVVAAIGVDAFLALWRIVDAHPANWHDSGTLRMSIRRYKSFLRSQRNRYIEALGRSRPALSIEEIRRRVNIAFGENLSTNHLSDILRRKGK